MLLRVLFFFVICGFMSSLQAATIWLNNGDRLTGDIVLLDDGKLVLKTKYAGQVVINWKNVRTLTSAKPLFVRKNNVETERSSQLLADGRGKVKIIGLKTRSLPLDKVTQLVAPRDDLGDKITKGNLSASFNVKHDEDHSNEVIINGDTSIEYGRWRHAIKGSLDHEKKNDITTDDNWELGYNADYFQTDKWFWRGSASHQRDDFDFVERESTLGFGPGYSFWNNKLTTFDLVTQINKVKRRTDLGKSTLNSLSLGWDYSHLLFGSYLELYTDGNVSIQNSDSVGYNIDGEAGLRYRINSWARLTLLYELEQTEEDGQSEADQEYTLGVGIGW